MTINNVKNFDSISILLKYQFKIYIFIRNKYIATFTVITAEHFDRLKQPVLFVVTGIQYFNIHYRWNSIYYAHKIAGYNIQSLHSYDCRIIRGNDAGLCLHSGTFFLLKCDIKDVFILVVSVPWKPLRWFHPLHLPPGQNFTFDKM